MADPLVSARRALSAARSVAVLTGAGISAESGIPTFRYAQTGLWARYDPMQLASEAGYRADPPLVWRWYAWRRKLVAEAQPNAGHRALALAANRFESWTLITQNVDGLHRRAGSLDAIALHGDITTTTCLARCGYRSESIESLPPGEPPKCPACGDWLRPAVVWFGEMLDPLKLEAAERAATGCDTMLVVGTSGVVYPAAGLATLAQARGATVVVVNPEPTDLDDGAILLRGRAADFLPRLLAP